MSRNSLGGVMVRWSTKKERQRHPEITVAGTWSKVDEACLYQNGFCESKFSHRPKNMPVGQILVFRWVIWKRKVTPYKYKSLYSRWRSNKPLATTRIRQWFQPKLELSGSRKGARRERSKWRKRAFSLRPNRQQVGQGSVERRWPFLRETKEPRILGDCV